VVTFIDITERKKDDLALQKSEEKYRRLIENMSDKCLLENPLIGNFTFHYMINIMIYLTPLSRT